MSILLIGFMIIIKFMYYNKNLYFFSVKLQILLENKSFFLLLTVLFQTSCPARRCQKQRFVFFL